MPQLRWYIHRLSSMSIGEVLHRFQELLRIKFERHKLSHPATPLSVLAIPDNAHSLYVRDDAPFFYFKWQDRDSILDAIHKDFPHGMEATLQQAVELLQHRITLFHHTFDFHESIDWHTDPLTGRPWPRLFYADIDTRDGQTVGGVKWVWELNRHHHLVTLAKAYFISGDERFAQDVCCQLQDWIEANPEGIGVNWTSSLELALRLINWIWALAFIRRSCSLTPQVFAHVMTSLVQQSRHIAAHMSAYSSANNHRIGEAAGLAMVGLVFPWLPHAAHYRALGMQILNREIEKQITPDGGPAEQAMSYLAFILDFYLLVGILAQHYQVDLPRLWYDRLAAACQFISSLLDNQGNLPAIGDSDDAWVVRLVDVPSHSRFRSILTTAAVFLPADQRWTDAQDWDEQSFWLLGTSGHSLFDRLPTAPASSSSVIFHQAGYALLRAPGIHLVFDIGRLGYLSTAAHGHADALSLWLTLNDQPILVDSGTFAYQEGDDWRDYFRSTRAHNTVVVDGKDQSQMLGTFLWGAKALPRLHHFASNPEYDYLVASHDGYKALGITHQRSIIFLKPDALFVIDDMIGSGEHAVSLFWHFPQGAYAEEMSDFVQVKCRSTEVCFYPPQNLRGQVALREGSTHPIQGWLSPEYGLKLPAPVLEYIHHGSLPVKLVTSIYLSPRKGSEYFSRLITRFHQIYSGV